MSAVDVMLSLATLCSVALALANWLRADMRAVDCEALRLELERVERARDDAQEEAARSARDATRAVTLAEKWERALQDVCGELAEVRHAQREAGGVQALNADLQANVGLLRVVATAASSLVLERSSVLSECPACHQGTDCTVCEGAQEAVRKLRKALEAERLYRREVAAVAS